MHSTIFEIRDCDFPYEDWAGESSIGDTDYYISGVDYYNEVRDAQERCERIEDFFNDWFPDKSFRIVKNEKNETAVLEFVGDMREIMNKWCADIKKNADAVVFNGTDPVNPFGLMDICRHPFGLDFKFYQDDWNGCTVDADDFLDFLFCTARANKWKPFRIYVGAVFDFHY